MMSCLFESRYFGMRNLVVVNTTRSLSIPAVAGLFRDDRRGERGFGNAIFKNEQSIPLPLRERLGEGFSSLP
jgi:hypothetical protein